MNFSNKRAVSILLAVIISILLVIMLIKTAPEKEPEMKALPKARVELAVVQTKDIAITEMLMGRLVPVRRAQLKFEVSGQLSERLVEAGQQVAPGHVLMRLDDRDYNNAAMDAKAQLSVEESAIKRDRELLQLVNENLRLQDNEVKRLQRLVKKSLTSQSSLDNARQQLSSLKREAASLKYNVDSATARLAIKQSAWEQANRQLQRCQLISPWKGAVNQVFIQAGDYVSPSQIALELIDDSELEFILSLRGEIAHHLQRDAVVDVTIMDETVSGKLVALQADPDPSTFTHEARIRLPAGVGYPGQMVKARISLPALKQAQVVPVTAVHYENGKQYVMLYANGKVSRQLIEPGPRVVNEQVVLSGLNEGARVVSRDVASLSDAQAVEIIDTNKP